MKVKWLPVSLIILPYPCLAVTAWLFAWQGTLDGSLLPLAALAAAGTVPNSAYALWLSARPQAETELLTWARRVKLGMCRCICCRWRCVLRWLSRWVGLLVVPVVLVAMYAALLPASLYALAALRLARERGALEKGEVRLHTLQLFVPGLGHYRGHGTACPPASARRGRKLTGQGAKPCPDAQNGQGKKTEKNCAESVDKRAKMR